MASLVAAVGIALAGGVYAPARGVPTNPGASKVPERIVPPALAALNAPRAEGLPADDRARGLVWAGLAPGRSGGPCAGLFEITTAAGVGCTHGPDMPPVGIEVSIPQLAAATETASTFPCIGDGSDGLRVQAVYAHAADVPDRYDSVAPLIRDAAGRVDQVFVDSAAETGGSRLVRWAADSSCALVIERVQLSSVGDDTLNNTISELQAVGLNRTDRKYLIWMDSTVYCGIGTIRGDDQPGQANLNNAGPSYSRVDSGCWGLANPVEAHELMHGLGGVQWAAPHSSMYWHCSDDSDRMCYQDEASVMMTYTCSIAHERLFDCNHDDYFHTSPPAGSYLATHWNTAMSLFLVDPTAPLPPPTTTTTSTSTTSTTTPPTTTTVPPQTTTLTYSGSLNRKQPSKAYDVTTSSGSMVMSLSFTKASTMTVTVVGPDSVVLAQQTGPSRLAFSVPVVAGANRVTVSSGGSTASFALTITYPQ